MTSVLVDTWTLDSAFTVMARKNTINKTHAMTWEHFLTSILLWDKVYFKDSAEQQSWQRFFEGTRKISIDALELDNILEPAWNREIDIAFSETTHGTHMDYGHGLHGYDEVLSKHIYERRTLIYIELAKILGANYMPHPLREHVFQIGENTQIDRRRVFTVIENKLDQYYSEANRLTDTNRYSFEYPLLFDYIRKKADKPSDQLMYALDLRNDPRIINFRKTMGKIQNADNWAEFAFLLHEVSRYTEQLIWDSKGIRRFGVIKLELAPQVPPIKATLETSVEIRNVFSYMLFVRKLVNFGMRKRRTE